MLTAAAAADTGALWDWRNWRESIVGKWC